MIRQESGEHGMDENNTTLLLKYKSPFDFLQILSFMRLRSMAGIEIVTDNSYSRTFRMENANGFFYGQRLPRTIRAGIKNIL